MDKLNFFTVDPLYVQYLKEAEMRERCFTRIPNMEYDPSRKPKFLLGVVLNVNGADYYVPVTSYKIQKPDNFLIHASNGTITSSLRFNYMFPIPKAVVTERVISTEPDVAYRALLAQELRYCIKHQDTIQKLAERTYKRVLLGKDHGLVINSCSFLLLESKCKTWIKEHTLDTQKEDTAEAAPEEHMENRANNLAPRKKTPSVIERLHSMTASFNNASSRAKAVQVEKEKGPR